MKISYKEIMEDTQKLWEEYKKDDKSIYINLYKNIFPEKEQNNIKSDFLKTNSNLNFQIEVNRYHSPVETYFCFEYDISNIIAVLRMDSAIRMYTKLCFYIENNIGSYSSITNIDN